MEFGNDFWRIFRAGQWLYSAIMTGFGRAFLWFLPFFFITDFASPWYMFIGVICGLGAEAVRRSSEDFILCFIFGVGFTSMILLPAFFGWGDGFLIKLLYWLVGAVLWVGISEIMSARFPGLWGMGKLSVSHEDMEIFMEKILLAVRLKLEDELDVADVMAARIIVSVRPKMVADTRIHGVQLSWSIKVFVDDRSVEGYWSYFERTFRRSCGEWLFYQGDVIESIERVSHPKSAHEKINTLSRAQGVGSMEGVLDRFVKEKRCLPRAYCRVKPYLS